MIECPKCGHRTDISESELAMVDNTITCPGCMSQLKVVDGIAYIPTDKAPIDQLEHTPPEFKGEQYYEQQQHSQYLDPLYERAVEYIRTCNAITLPMLQRYFGLTPERAEELMQQLEDNKVVAPFDGLHPRKILIPHNEKLPGIVTRTQELDDMMGATPGADGEPGKVRSCTVSLPGCGVVILILCLIYLLIHFLR